MTVVVPAEQTLTAEASAIYLARYAQIIQQPPNSFWGVAKDSERGSVGTCFEIFSKSQRDTIARYLAEAQEEIESVIGYFLSPRYVVGKIADQPNGNDRYVDDQAWGCPITLRWPKFLGAGVRAETTIQASAAVNHATDPATIGPIATTVTDPDEISVFHPGLDVEINPSLVTIAGGFVTILVPRCRLVLSALADNPSTGLEYTDLANFESTVDVKRVYLDPSVQAELVTAHCCTAACLPGCTETLAAGCIHAHDPRLGFSTVTPGTYTDGAWVTGSTCDFPLRARLNYKAGMDKLTRQAEDVIVRLAHSKLPHPICGCDFAVNTWKRDQSIPQFMTRERINCPFGTNDGAWHAWKFAWAMKNWRAGVL